MKNLAEFRTKYKRYEGLVFFAVGFLFDVITLRRIDDWLKLGFQILFIVLVSLFLIRDYKLTQSQWEPARAFEKIWKYQTEIVHFMFGSLLSAFVIFYFKSSSLTHSLFFMIVLALLLFMNESSQFREQGLSIKICLLSFCLSSFLIYFLPLVTGSLGLFLFVAALILSTVIFAGFIWILWWQSNDREHYKKVLLFRHVWPSLAVTAFLLLSYFLKIIPPVPLSMQFGGIYHQIEKENSTFKLYSMKPWYRFWSNGDSTFLARPDDKIFCYFRIFAPAKFSHKVYLHWSLLSPNSHNYESQDRIEIPIVGGREDGFRGSSFKSNYQPGQWRVEVETEDGRVIGNIDFTVEKDLTTDVRVWKIEES
jgi:hypothetical protein